MLFAASASPAIQLRCAEVYAAARYPAAQPLWRGERYAHPRIRLAYVSADFRNHPVSHLTAGLFEAHDRARFETVAVSIAPALEDDMQRRLRGAFERYVDVAERSDREIADLLRAWEIDIAIDLTGFTGLVADRGVCAAAGAGTGDISRLSGNHGDRLLRLYRCRPHHHSAGARRVL